MMSRHTENCKSKIKILLSKKRTTVPVENMWGKKRVSDAEPITP